MGELEKVIYDRAYWKVDERNEEVDIRTLSKARLSALIKHYQDLSNRARSALIKSLYQGIREDLIKFRESGQAPRADALSWARFMEIEDVRYFMREYWNGEPFPEHVSTQFSLRLFLENVRILALIPSVALSENLRLRRTLAEERKVIRPVRDPLFGPTKYGCVVETWFNYSPKEEFLQEYEKATQTIQSVFVALLLFRDRLAKRDNYVVETRSDPPRLDASCKYSRPFAPSWRRLVSAHHRFWYDLRPDDLSEFKAFWTKFQKAKDWIPQISLHRFADATGMAGEENKRVYRFVDYVTSMESLLLEGQGEFSYKLSMRTAAILGTSPQERQDVYEFMSEAYDFRSKLVHGEMAKPIKVRATQINLDETLGRLHSYTYRSLRRAFEILEFAPIGVNRKRWLVDLLDLSLVNGDIARILYAYLNHRIEGRKLIEIYDRARKLQFDLRFGQ
jgi:hypothetical protein